jgi:GAF domain-containing protein
MGAVRGRPALPDAAPALAALAGCAAAPHDRDALAMVAVREIGRAIPQASWRGVYWLHGDALVLGPYEGPPTDHVRIPVGVGVCGTAVAEDRDQVVRDVRERENYLSCSANVRSEIVVLVRSGTRVLGQIDLDSEQVGAFGEAEHRYLKMVAHALGALVAAT